MYSLNGGNVMVKNYSKVYFNEVYNIVHETIENVYPKYYPRSAVDFFHKHHSKGNMEKQLLEEFTLVFFQNNKPIGTGALNENEIKRFFILPDYQSKGYGKKLLKELEKNIDRNKFYKLVLDSSLGAVKFYLKNDYLYKNYKIIDLSDGSYLCYLKMEKIIV